MSVGSVSTAAQIIGTENDEALSLGNNFFEQVLSLGGTDTLKFSKKMSLNMLLLMGVAVLIFYFLKMLAPRWQRL